MNMLEAKALDELETHLRWLHPNYTIKDVKPAQTRGYLEFTKPCPGRPECTPEEHYHTIDISGHPRFVLGNYGRGIYAYWRAVCQALAEQRRGRRR